LCYNLGIAQTSSPYDKGLIMNKLFLVLLSCICLIIYAGYLNNAFVFDDKILVENNPLVKSARLLPNVFKSGIYDYWAGAAPYDRMYRPLQMLSYYIDYSLWGLSPAGFRFSNILLHLFNAILVFYLFNLLFRQKALAFSASLLFMVHPVQVSTVAYISARGDLLSAFFILACCILFLKFLLSDNSIFYFLSMLSAGLAFLSRENALLITIFLIPVIYASNRGGHKLRYLRGFLILSAAYLAIRLLIFGVSGLATHTGHIQGVLSLINLLNIAWRYVLLLLWPADLRMFHSTAFINPTGTFILFLFLAGLALLLTAIFKWQKIKAMPQVIIFGLAWFIFAIIPVYYYFDAYPALGVALMAENWLYLPAIGFCIVTAYLCLLNKRGRLIIYTWAIILGMLAVSNQVYWRNDVTFYKRALQFLPEDSIIQRNLVTAYIDAGDLPGAAKAIEVLERYYMDTPVVDLARGQYYFACGQAKEALNYYQRIISKSFFSNYSISLCYAKLGDANKAIAFSQASFKQNPFFQKNLRHLASLYSESGQLELAHKYLLLAKQLDPKSR